MIIIVITIGCAFAAGLVAYALCAINRDDDQ